MNVQIEIDDKVKSAMDLVIAEYETRSGQQIGYTELIAWVLLDQMGAPSIVGGVVHSVMLSEAPRGPLS